MESGLPCVDLTQWSPACRALIQEDFAEAILNASASEATGLHLAYAHQACNVVGLALYEFVAGRRHRYAQLHDLLVATAWRGNAIGTKLLLHVEAQAKAADINQLFLESGRHNDQAHAFFHRHGFATCAVTMLKQW